MGNRSGTTVRRYSFNMLRWVITTALLTSLCVTNASAQLLVTDNFGPSVLMYNQTTGAFEGTLVPPGSGGLITAHGIEIGPDGNIYVARSSSAINRYSPSGAFLGAFTSGASTIALTVIFGPDGNLYVGDYDSGGEIKRFNGTTGAYIDTFVAAGSGGLNFPNGMAFGPDGNFYVSSGNSNSVKRYNGTTGAYIGDFATGPTDPRGLVFGPDGNLYVSFDGIRRYNGTTGAFIDLFASAGLDGGLSRPYGLDFGPDGNLYVARDGGSVPGILRYNGTTGAFIDIFASGGGLGSPKYFVFTEEPAVNEPPTAEAGANQSIHAGQTVLLDGSGSFDDTTPTQNLQYAWSFTSVPLGSTATFSDPNASNPAFVADLPGTYVVSLVVTDEDELPSNPDEVTISSQNAPPNADAGPDQGTFVGNLVSLNGSASNDPDFDLITFSWTLITQPAGSTATLSDADTATPTFVPDLPGSYVVELIVSDPFVASAPDQVIVVITTEYFAEQQTVNAINTVGSLPPSSVTTKGNQTALGNFLTQVIAALQVGDVSEAKNKLQDAIERTDGCALRGSPDISGGGQIKQDYIKTCTDQAPVYTLLKDALDALSGP